MSLWTPDGEHSVSNEQPGGSMPPGAPGGEPGQHGAKEPELTPEQEEQARAMAHELAEARSRLLEAPASTVVVNHALGIYELAAIHLTADQPQLTEAQLAIDALAALVEGLSGRLGEAEASLVDALHHVRLAFVSQSEASGGDQPADAPADT